MKIHWGEADLTKGGQVGVWNGSFLMLSQQNDYAGRGTLSIWALS